MWRLMLSRLDVQGELEWSKALLGGSFVPAKKGGDAVGKTKVGKGSKAMVIADSQGLPIGLHVESARPHESQLA